MPRKRPWQSPRVKELVQVLVLLEQELRHSQRQQSTLIVLVRPLLWRQRRKQVLLEEHIRRKVQAQRRMLWTKMFPRAITQMQQQQQQPALLASALKVLVKQRQVKIRAECYQDLHR